MKIEGIVYFAGISFGTWMTKSFWHIAKFPAIVGIVFIFLGCVGYGMKFYFWNDRRKKYRKFLENY